MSFLWSGPSRRVASAGQEMGSVSSKLASAFFNIPTFLTFFKHSNYVRMEIGGKHRNCHNLILNGGTSQLQMSAAGVKDQEILVHFAIHSMLCHSGAFMRCLAQSRKFTPVFP